MVIVSYVKCPKCEEIANLETTATRTKLSGVEIKQRTVAKRMIKIC